jgi:hypothetical protein
VLFFFFAYRSAEGDESVSFESSSLLLFLLKEEREKKKLVIEWSFFLSSCFREKKIRVLAFITRSAVLFFFFAYRSAEGDESVFELSLLLLFLLKEEREKKILVIE